VQASVQKKNIDNHIEGQFLKPSVLIIDDEKRIRSVCYNMLRQEGYDPAEAEDAEIGIDMIGRRHFDIILLDLMMPGVSGMEALESIRALHPDTVVIVITGYATLDHAVNAMKKGAFDFLSKPFSPQDLRLVLTKAIEHTRTLKDIAEEKSRLHTMVNLLTDGVMATDSEKNVALANPFFLNLMNCKCTSPVGKPVEELVTQKQILDLIDQALEMKCDEFAELVDEFTLTCNQLKEERVLGVRCIPFRDRLGRNLGTITVLHDITTLKQMDQMKSDFVSMVSHEIRGPMNSILMQHKVILDNLAGELTEKQRRILSRTSEKIKALVTLSTQLLDLAKMESGLINMEKERLELSPILNDQISFHRPKAQAKGITIELSPLSEALPPILANRMNMEELLSNLISNAIQYTPENGRINIAAALEADYICIKIADTGMGIPPEDLDQIFKRFYRVKNEKTRYIIGTGLGLPIVKSIVEAHNGRIQVESTVDQGSTFSVFLPIVYN
jgi:two-component system phosphate regulon sensor histidine kinase PhoR